MRRNIFKNLPLVYISEQQNIQFTQRIPRMRNQKSIVNVRNETIIPNMWFYKTRRFCYFFVFMKNANLIIHPSGVFFGIRNAEFEVSVIQRSGMDFFSVQV